jgi:hypothetical protein
MAASSGFLQKISPYRWLVTRPAKSPPPAEGAQFGQVGNRTVEHEGHFLDRDDNPSLKTVCYT